MAMTSVPRPDDSRRVAPHEETIVSSNSGAGSGSGNGSKSSRSGGLSSGGSLHEAPALPVVTVEEFTASLTASGLMTAEELNSFCETIHGRDALTDADAFADLLVKANKLTPYQAETLRQGHTRGLVLGNYVILEKLGEGGMGMVFLARHRLMKRIVALKVLPPSMTQSADAVARFHREVEAAAKLQYANIAGAFDADQADGIHFLVMEYVEGPNLANLVREAGPLSPAVAMNIVAQAARGLLHAHENGVVHRDIKPGNLLVSKDGVVKILDMGLAQLQSSEENNGARAELTQSGRIMGTVDYMAPEQALDAKTVDQRADIYSLGCTLFYLLTGRPMSPEGTLTQKLLWHQTEAVPSLKSVSPTVPDELDAIFQKMVAKRADDRFNTMGDLLAQLDPLLASVPAEELKLPSTGVGLSKETGSVTDYSGRGKLTMVDRSTRSDAGGTIGWQDSGRPGPSPVARPTSSGMGKVLIAAAGLGMMGIAAGVGIFMAFAPPQPSSSTVITAIKQTTIIVKSNQPNARVLVDNKEMGQTNGAEPYDFKLTLRPGKYKVRVERSGFAAFIQDLTINPDQPELTLQAALAAEPATIVLTSEIPGVQVSIDGEAKGVLVGDKPYRLTIGDLPAGDHRVHLEAEGYIAKDEPVKLTAGKSASLPVKLAERPFRELISWVFENVDHNADEPAVVVDDGSGVTQNAKKWSDLTKNYSKINEINLANGSVNDGNLKQLAMADTLQFLSLSGTKVGDEGVKSLQKLSGLERLDLSKTAIMDKALSYVATLSKLRELDLRGTSVTDRGMLSLAKASNLEVLRLSDTSIGDEGAKRLLGLNALQTLSVDGTRITTESYDAFAAVFKDKNPINPAELDPELGLARKLLHGGAELVVQSSVGAAAKPKPVKLLSELPSARFHILGITTNTSRDVNDALMMQLVGLKHLAEIDLNGSQVTDSGLALLSQIPSLRKIDLGYLSVAKGTVDALKQDLPEAADNITWHGPRDRVAAEWVLKRGGKVAVSGSQSKLVSDPKALPENSVFTLEEIHLVDKPEIVDADLSGFKDLANLKTLNLVGTSVTDEGLKKLTGLDKLKTLCLSGKTIKSSALSVVALNFASLERLYLADTAIDSAGLQQFKKLDTVTQLSLAGTAIKDADLAPLSALTNLTWLSLDGTSLTDGAVRFLAPLKSLKVLSLGDQWLDSSQQMMDPDVLPGAPARAGMRFTDAGLEELERALPQCKILHRPLDEQRQVVKWVLENQGSAVVSVGGAKPVRIAKVGDLPRSGCQVLQVALKGRKDLPRNFLNAKLSPCQDLTVLELSDSEIDDKHLEGLDGFPKLVGLNLDNTDVDDDLFARLAKLPALRVLSLRGTPVTGATLADSPLTSLTHLYLGSSNFRGSNLKYLKDATELVELDLYGLASVVDADIKDLGTLAKLQRLDLFGTRLTDASGAIVAKYKALRWIRLYNVPITDAFISQWTEMPELQEVVLTKTKVTDAALAHLDGFKKLQRVWVFSTAVTEGGAQALRARGVTVNKSDDPAPRDENTSGASGRFGGL